MRASLIQALLAPVLGVRVPTYIITGRALEEPGTRTSPTTIAGPGVADLDPVNVVSRAQGAEYSADVQNDGLQAASDESSLFRPFTSFTSALRDAEPDMLNSSDSYTSDEGSRRLQGCTDWDAAPYAPPSDAFDVSRGVGAFILTCSLFIALDV